MKVNYMRGISWNWFINDSAWKILPTKCIKILANTFILLLLLFVELCIYVHIYYVIYYTRNL